MNAQIFNEIKILFITGKFLAQILFFIFIIAIGVFYFEQNTTSEDGYVRFQNLNNYIIEILELIISIAEFLINYLKKETLSNIITKDIIDVIHFFTLLVIFYIGFLIELEQAIIEQAEIEIERSNSILNTDKLLNK